MKSVGHNKATVKREKLEDVVGNDTYYINNHLDEKYEPHPIQDILQDAKILVDKELQYGVTTKNCEHFVTLLRYGQPHSQQVQLFDLTSQTESYCMLLISDSNVKNHSITDAK